MGKILQTQGILRKGWKIGHPFCQNLKRIWHHCTINFKYLISMNFTIQIAVFYSDWCISEYFIDFVQNSQITIHKYVFVKMDFYTNLVSDFCFKLRKYHILKIKWKMLKKESNKSYQFFFAYFLFDQAHWNDCQTLQTKNLSVKLCFPCVMLINFKNVSISDGKISSLHLLNFKSSLLTLIDFERTEFAMLQKHIIFQVGIITSSLFT